MLNLISIVINLKINLKKLQLIDCALLVLTVTKGKSIILSHHFLPNKIDNT